MTRSLMSICMDTCCCYDSHNSFFHVPIAHAHRRPLAV